VLFLTYPATTPRPHRRSKQEIALRAALTIGGSSVYHLIQGNVVISIDTKKKELLGNFHRAGTTFTAATVATFDHDCGSAGQGKLTPHGIYDLVHKQAHIHLNTSHDTSELWCNSVALWWEEAGRMAYPQAQRLLVLGDGGGSNSATQYLFKEDLQGLANR
jgi:hypothetical protein